ncbi:STAS domain-containing protein [Actinoplanes sp. RD1]|uniref:STAS domain-containing protein n=1 Tax=Actinoplanes sp. RD1 TaxID=3064538 RepID=UPI00274220E3|nr:STAS domain-containing protein [Actinoplanes sp. RD1]
MSDAVQVESRPDGDLVIQPHGAVGPDAAEELRRLLVHAVRRTRPSRLVLDLGDVSHLDSINVGTLAATCTICDHHRVEILLDNTPAFLAGRLTAAGIPRQLIRQP